MLAEPWIYKNHVISYFSYWEKHKILDQIQYFWALIAFLLVIYY